MGSEKANQIDWDWIAKHLEGEGFRKGYVPIDKRTGKIIGTSGVTIATGVDLGTKDRKFFEDIGVSEGIILKLEPFFQLKGEEALKNAKKLELSASEVKEVDTAIRKKYTNDVINAYEKDSGKNFEDLTSAQQTITASVALQHGDLKTSAPDFWDQVLNDEWDDAIANLRDWDGTGKPSQTQTRRDKEANLLEGKSPSLFDQLKGMFKDFSKNLQYQLDTIGEPDPARYRGSTTSGGGQSSSPQGMFHQTGENKMAVSNIDMGSGLEDLNDEEKMNKLLAALVADEEPEISASAVRQHPFLQSLLQIRNNPIPGYGLHGTGGDGSLYRGSIASGGGQSPSSGVPGQLDHPIFQQSFSGGAKQNDFWKLVDAFGKRYPPPDKVNDLIDMFGRWLERYPPPEERPHDKVIDFGKGMFQKPIYKLRDFGSTAYPFVQNLREEFGDLFHVPLEELPGAPTPSDYYADDHSIFQPPFAPDGVGAPLPFPGQLDHRIFGGYGVPSLGGGMLISEAPGRDSSSSMDSGLEGWNANKEESSQAHMDKYGSGFEDPTKPTEEEPELFGTLWNLIQKSLQKDAKSLTGMFGEGKDDTPFFKPLSASQLVEHEKFVNQAPLVERWAAQMKEEIGWQYMTPDERKDYIKKNKHDKNNNIIMDYNMYRRRRK